MEHRSKESDDIRVMKILCRLAGLPEDAPIRKITLIAEVGNLPRIEVESFIYKDEVDKLEENLKGSKFQAAMQRIENIEDKSLSPSEWKEMDDRLLRITRQYKEKVFGEELLKQRQQQVSQQVIAPAIDELMKQGVIPNCNYETTWPNTPSYPLGTPIIQLEELTNTPQKLNALKEMRFPYEDITFSYEDGSQIECTGTLTVEMKEELVEEDQPILVGESK